MNGHCYKIAYWGYSSKMLEELCQCTYFKIDLVVYVPKRVNKEFLSIIRKYNIESIQIHSKFELKCLLERDLHFEAVIMYKFEYILPADFVKTQVVINFHGGNLRTNRGAHAVVWSILRGESKTCLSMYQLTGGIDEGRLIGEYWVDIDETDSSDSLNEKLQCGIPILLEKLDLYLKGEAKSELILGGEYLPKITERDYTIDAANDSFKIIKRKINSQLAYFGAVIYIDGIKYRVTRYAERKGVEVEERQIFFSDRTLTIKEDKSILLLFCRKDMEKHS